LTRPRGRWRTTWPGFDDLLVSRAQRRALRDYVIALLQPRDRNKTLTALVGAEPGVGSTHREVQRLQWFVSESPWEHEPINDRRIELLMKTPVTAPHGGGALLLDDSGDRKSGHATAYVSRQYIGSRAQVDNGIVAVSTAWADERIYYPLHVVPYRPAPTLPGGRADPAFRTKGQLAAELVDRARAAGVAFRALVADCFYGPSESPHLIAVLDAQHVPYAVAIKPNTPIMTSTGQTITPRERVGQAGWISPRHPGRWRPVRRRYRDGHTETWWAIELRVGRYGPGRTHRLIVATCDPVNLPATGTFSLTTNLPRRARKGSPSSPANLAEVVRLYGLRGWIEQDYKQIKHELGWADFQVRSGHAICRHWTLVNLAFTFCWLQPEDPDSTAAASPFREKGSLPSPSGDPPLRGTWPERLRRVRAYLTPIRDLTRLARDGALNLAVPELAGLLVALVKGVGVHLYLPP
jgi:SRSO17 transposase